MRAIPMRASLAGASLLIATVLIGCARASETPETDAAGPEAEAAVVRLLSVGDTARPVERTATGTVRLRRETPLAFTETGRITRITVREGDTVPAGALLAAIDTTAIDAGVASADAEAARARAELSRQQQLLRQGWVAQARVDAAAAAARAADAQLARARQQQRFGTIRAPASGMVLQRLAEPGETIAAGSPVLVLGEFASGHVLRVAVGAADARAMAPGTVADIVFRDGAAPAMRGTVIEVSGRADPRTGTFQVELALPDGAGLRSGMIAEARWRAGGAGEQTLLVPATALFSARAGEAFVWRLDPASGRVGARLVRLGETSDRGVAILSGLAPGDRIVMAGVDRLVEGQRVKPVADS